MAIGINEYADTRRNLNYAVSDAEDFSAEILEQQLKLKQYAQTLVIRLTNREATRANLLHAIRGFASGKDGMPAPARLPASIRTIPVLQPEDALVIYFAGHGEGHANVFT